MIKYIILLLLISIIGCAAPQRDAQKSVTLLFGGDLMVARRLEASLKKHNAGCDFPFKKIA